MTKNMFPEKIVYVDVLHILIYFFNFLKWKNNGMLCLCLTHAMIFSVIFKDAKKTFSNRFYNLFLYDNISIN